MSKHMERAEAKMKGRAETKRRDFERRMKRQGQGF